MENLIPETCCCVFGLETGATIIGGLTLVFGVVLAIIRFGAVPSITPADSTELTIEIAVVALAILAGLSLILAVKTQKRLLCWPYLILQTLVIILMVYQLVTAAIALQDTPLVKTALQKISEFSDTTDTGAADPALPPGVTSAPQPAFTTKKATTPASKPTAKTTFSPDPILGSIEDDILVDFLVADPPAGLNTTMLADGMKEPPSDTRLVFEIARDAALTGVCVYFLLVVYSFYRKLGYSVTAQKPEV